MEKLGYYLTRPGHYLSPIYHEIPLIIFCIILVFKLLLFTYITGHGIETFFSSFGIILAILSLSLLLKSHVFKFLYLFSINFLCSILLFTHALYFSYFGDFASIFFIKQIHQIKDVSDVILSMIDKELLFIADLLILPFLFIRFKNICNCNISGKLKTFFFLLLLSFLFNIYSFIYYVRSTDNILESIFYRNDFVKYMGIINYQIIDLYYFLLTERQKAQISASDIEEVMDWKLQNKISIKNDFSGIGKGLNLVIIQVESLQNFVIGKTYNNREITPNLNKLVKEGIYFNNIYDQTAAGNTSDATLLANSSLYPSRKGAASFLYSQNNFDSLPKVLREHGYTTAVMEAYKKHFWNNLAFDTGLGFQHQFYENSYIITDTIGKRFRALSDKSFFHQSTDKLTKLPNPFYVLLRTLSTHAPFNSISSDVDSFPLADLEGEIIGHYIKSMHYVDSAIGEFLHNLYVSNLASDIVIVIYGDHHARLPEGELKRLSVYDLNEYNKIPLIIFLTNKKMGHQSNTIGGLIDVTPTICNILGIDISDKFFLGRDLLNSNNSFVIFRNSSYISSDNSIDKIYSQEQLRISDLILEKDLITFIKNKEKH